MSVLPVAHRLGFVNLSINAICFFLEQQIQSRTGRLILELTVELGHVGVYLAMLS